VADVRFLASGAPVVGDFSSSTGTPLIIDISTGDIYALLTGDVVTLVGSIAGGASYTLAGQSLGKHVMPALPDDIANVAEHLSNRAFDRQVAPAPQDWSDSQPHMANRVFDRPVPLAQPDLGDVTRHLADRVFDRQVMPQLQAVLGDAASMIQAQVFSPKRMPAMWST
jgi:hypothetical protein